MGAAFGGKRKGKRRRKDEFPLRVPLRLRVP